MRTTARLAVAVAGTTAALLVGGAGTAFADDPETTQGPITLTPEQATYVCTTRIPAILDRVGRLSARISADPSTPGSTAWLEARRDHADGAGRTEVADRLQERIDGRPEKLDRLDEVTQRVTAFRDVNCVS